MSLLPRLAPSDTILPRRRLKRPHPQSALHRLSYSYGEGRFELPTPRRERSSLSLFPLPSQTFSAPHGERKAKGAKTEGTFFAKRSLPFPTVLRLRRSNLRTVYAKIAVFCLYSSSGSSLAAFFFSSISLRKLSASASSSAMPLTCSASSSGVEPSAVKWS